MKKLHILAMICTMAVLPLIVFGQSNSVTVTVIAPPSWTITVAPGNFYQNQAATMTITVIAGPVANTCTAVWDSTNLPLTFPNPIPATNPVVITAAVSASMTANVGSHKVILTCPLPTLTMNSPVTLPNAKQGTAYSANLATLTQLSGGTPPYSWTLSGGALPTGLSLSSAGVVSGTPSGAGSFNFQFSVNDSTAVATNQLQGDTWGRLDASHPVLLTWQQPQETPISGDPADGVLSAQSFNVYRRESPGDPTFRSTRNQLSR